MAVDQLPGLGPKSASWLARIGIGTIEDLKRRDPFDVYAELKAIEPKVNLNMLYGLIVPWQQVARERRTEILLRLDEMGLV